MQKAPFGALFLCGAIGVRYDSGMSSKKEKSGRSTAHKIKLRGRDGAPLSMQELQQGLYEAARRLKPYKDCRAKWITLYLTIVDEHGEEVILDRKGEWVLYPYECAADEL